MKTPILLALALALFCSACQNSTVISEPSALQNAQPNYPTQAVLSTTALQDQVFKLNPNRDTIISTRSGTRLHIDRNCFLHKDGTPVTTAVNVELKEAITPEDILQAGLVTMSDDKVLSSGGMFFTNYTSEGAEVDFAPGKSVRMDVPTAEFDEDMQLFQGVKDEVTGKINWVNPQPIITKLEESKHSDEPFRPMKASANDDRVFEVAFRDTSKYPEFLEYKNIKFQAEKSCGYSPADSLIQWTSVELSPLSKGKYAIKFESINDGKILTKKYKVSPVFVEGDYEEALKVYEKKRSELAAARKEQERIKAEQVELEIAIQAQKDKAAREREAYLKTPAGKAELAKTAAVKKVIAETSSTVYYTFQMGVCGWSNIDRYYHDPSMKPASIVVSVTNSISEPWKDLEAHCMIYQDKVLLHASPINDTSLSFDVIYGLVLPRNRAARVVVTAIRDTQLFCGSVDFSIQDINDLKVTLKPATQEQLKEQLENKVAV